LRCELAKRKRRKGVEESSEVLKKRAEQLAQQPDYDSKKKPAALQALLFTLGEQILAIDAKCVKEILNPFVLKWVPFTPKFLAGVVNLRGDIVTVFDMGTLQGKESSEEESEIIVLKYEDMKCGLLVDKADEILAVNDGELLDPVPSDQKISDFVGGTIKKDKHLYQLIDLKKILESDEVAALRNSPNAQDKTIADLIT
jgi:purine-binding chemotaxis protein CheW